jgi:hypothetical protein
MDIVRPVRGSVRCVVNLLYPNNVKLLVRAALRALRSLAAFGVWSAEDLREFQSCAGMCLGFASHAKCVGRD